MMKAPDTENKLCNADSLQSNFQLLWAKSHPYKQLLAHMLDAGCCAKAYLTAHSSQALLQFLSSQWSCSPEEAISFAAYLSSMHDIGKAIPQFQMQDRQQQERLMRTAIAECLPTGYLEPVRHEYFSAEIFKRIWKDDRRLKNSYACVLALHHQRVDRLPKGRRHPLSDEWIAMQDALEKTVRDVFQVSTKLLRPTHLDAVCIFLTGLIILCDWVASSGPFDEDANVGDGYVSKSIKIAAKALKSYGLISDSVYPEVNGFHAVWPKIVKPRAIQRLCDQLNPDAPLTIIEAPMGEGKTEAALCLAARICAKRKKRGVYIALPTQATSNQMYKRVETMLDTIHAGHARLLHGTAFLHETEYNIQSEDAKEAEQWLRPLRMGLLAENGVGTVDQAMAGVLMTKFSVLRLLGLSNKVLVIDEIHAYDAYMSKIICSLLCWCRELCIPVILLSATLQDSQRIAYLSCYTEKTDESDLLRNYPLITQAFPDKTVTQISCEATLKTDYLFETVPLGDDCSRFAKYAAEKVKDGGCYCILVNTVRHAQEVYKALLEMKEQDTEIILFHARFPVGRREEIEKLCLTKFGKQSEAQRPEKAILVATQVVEQSLDIDFDGMLSELAPIDLLLQRAGRIHRHRERTRPENFRKPVLQVILPDLTAEPDIEKRYGLSGKIYAPFLLYNTECLLGNQLRVQVPEDVRTVIGKVYEQVTDENQKAWKARIFDQEWQQANADSVTFPVPNAGSFFPDQSHPDFEPVEVDDGYESALRAATRLGEPTIRIAFCSSALVESARTGCLSKKQEKDIFLASASIRANRVSKRDLENSSLFQIKKGPLRGCFLSDRSDIIRFDRISIVNDPILGIFWRE